MLLRCDTESKNRLMEKEKEIAHLAQVAKVGKLPSEAALVSDLRAFGAEMNRKISRSKCKSGCTMTYAKEIFVFFYL